MNDLLEKKRKPAAKAVAGPTHVRSKDVFEDLDIRPTSVERLKVQMAVQINEVLAKRGATQALRAQALGVSQPIVSNIERLELAGISLDRLVRYAEHLGLSTDVRLSASAEKDSNE